MKNDLKELVSDLDERYRGAYRDLTSQVLPSLKTTSPQTRHLFIIEPDATGEPLLTWYPAANKDVPAEYLYPVDNGGAPAFLQSAITSAESAISAKGPPQLVLAQALYDLIEETRGNLELKRTARAWFEGQRRTHDIQGSVFELALTEIHGNIDQQTEENAGLPLAYLSRNYLAHIGFRDTPIKELLLEVGSILQHQERLFNDDVSSDPWNVRRLQTWVTNLSVVIAPFQSLGVLRGAVAWFTDARSLSVDSGPVGAENESKLFRPNIAAERSEILGDSEPPHEGWFRATLAQLYGIQTQASIDVFTTSLTTILAGASMEDTDQLRKAAKSALLYLFPAKCANFGPPRERADDFVTLRFSPDNAQILGESEFTWELPFPRHYATLPSGLKTNPNQYQNLLNLKISNALHHARQLETLRSDSRFGLSFGMFGHHMGNLMKNSGLAQLISRTWVKDEIPAADVRRVAYNLMSVWGISTSVGLVKPREGSEWSNTIDRWLHQPTICSEDLDDQMERALIRIISFLYRQSRNSKAILQWQLYDSSGCQVPFDDVEGANILPSLPIFCDDPLLRDKTMAVLMGLIELVVNLSHYPESDANREYYRRAIKDSGDQAVTISIQKEFNDEAEIDGLAVELRQPFVCAAYEAANFNVSRSIQIIQLIEQPSWKTFVRTGSLIPENIPESDHRLQVIRCRQRWQFRYRSLIKHVKESKQNDYGETGILVGNPI